MCWTVRSVGKSTLASKSRKQSNLSKRVSRKVGSVDTIPLPSSDSVPLTSLCLQGLRRLHICKCGAALLLVQLLRLDVHHYVASITPCSAAVYHEIVIPAELGAGAQPITKDTEICVFQQQHRNTPTKADVPTLHAF